MKNRKPFPQLIIPVYLACALLGQIFVFSPAASADTLRGNVNEDDVLRGGGPSLSRGDMSRQPDSFTNGGGEQKSDDGMLQAPPGAFDQTNVFQAAGAPKPFQMGAGCEGGDSPFNGQQAVPQMERSQQPPVNNMGSNPNNNPIRTIAPPVNNDPEQSDQMQLLWDAWHKRVAETIYVRFNGAAQMLFSRSQPMACQVSYMVARDGRIGNVRILQPSASAAYNNMLLGIIKSIAGDPVLQYPPNSRRQFVEKTGTFTWNYSPNQGFKYTTNDREQISIRGR
jgi:TonB C terminal